MSTIAELAPDRTVEGVYAVARKQRRTTRKGAPYLALELVDPTGRVEGRVWNDVELLDGRFAEGDAVRVLARVEKFRDRLQLDVRSLEAADVDPQTLTPALRRDRDLAMFPATHDDHHSYAGGLLEHTVGVATLARETAQLHPRLRSDLLLAAALLHDVGRARELRGAPSFRA